MTWAEIGTAVVGLVLGYLCISYLVSGGTPPASGESRNGPAGEGADAAGDRDKGPSAGDRAAPTPWSTVLGVSPDADPAAIREAYRHLISQYHPDKVAALGPELREFAERKSKEITAAYREATGTAGGTQ